VFAFNGCSAIAGDFTPLSRLATCHSAATEGNRERPVAEGFDAGHVFDTSNPVVDSLKGFLPTPS
jgi:UDP-N-acetylglucosamine 2-epimerase